MIGSALGVVLALVLQSGFPAREEPEKEPRALAQEAEPEQPVSLVPS